MCRLMGYLGLPISLDRLLYKPDHSLVVQSYQPRQMTSGLLNADGFGVGWYRPERDVLPFTYRNTLPIWNDVNLSDLSRYVESNCVLASVRSATAGQAVDLSNCQPYKYDRFLGIHNGFIENFRQTLYRPIRDRLTDSFYQAIQGSTDSEHIFALLFNELHLAPDLSLEKALYKTLILLTDMAQVYGVGFAANLIVTDGARLVASRFASRGKATSSPQPAPSLYWLQDDPHYPEATLIASEPLFLGNWVSCPERSVLTIGEDLDIQIHQF
ncbi:ergothioneine biosynthesis protein EgtC [Leptolyngbya sp. 'hensonii']|uniref:ergothioneine biosynthesis protein EgtC n=1 Tax=Leptolyngbya sp. 'hensonii' TaxID=1922337 RepID=UPI00095008DF|nr:ergothioneine biosynthesis protein EgtC [Leptolyngbya sp. 'hensonii']OLP16769.1 ergothioneine biosynthesis protein EgtC [Leptolyngbya sp. 'hensonii']